MGSWHAYGPNFHMTGTDVDAKFQHNGKTILMSFHNYCGPLFETPDGEGRLIELEPVPDDSPEFEDLWRQFYGWWKAKGQHLYLRETDAGQPIFIDEPTTESEAR